MALFWIFLSLMLVLRSASAQDEGGAVTWEPLTEEQERNIQLVHGPHLLPFAAPYSSRIRVEQTRPQQTIIAQYRTSVTFDCSPWLRMFGGSKSEWLEQSYQSGPNGLVPYESMYLDNMILKYNKSCPFFFF